jgi:hypothetical protein
MQLTKRSVNSFYFLAFSLLVGMLLVGLHGAYAQQVGGKNKPAAQKAQQAAKAKQAQPAKRARRPKPKPYRPRYRYLVDQPQYWHPYYRHRPRWQVYAWEEVGYPYYPGGTHYIVLLSQASVPKEIPEVDTKVKPIRGLGKRQVDDRYVQMQEITDVVHEWRTLNESVELHERVRMAMDASLYKSLVESIQKTNKQFDRATRNAMYKLSCGHKADDELAEASRQLSQLQQLAKKLPAPPEHPEPHELP